MINLTAWLAAVDGVRIDHDNYPANDPYQCWDLWADYAMRVVGMPRADTFTSRGGSKPHGGYACNVFHNLDSVPALRSRFYLLGPDDLAQPGDVAFWERGSLYAGSHVAIVVADLGDKLRCMSQNKGPGLDAAGYQTLPKRTLLGYLRPRLKSTASRPEPAAPAAAVPKGNPTMFLVRILETGAVHLVTANGNVHMTDSKTVGWVQRMIQDQGGKGDITPLYAAEFANVMATIRKAA